MESLIMSSSLIEYLKTEFGQAVEYIDVPGFTKEGWFLLEICPFPQVEEINQIVSDIQNDRVIGVQNGKLIHLDYCEALNHKIFSSEVRKAIKDIRKQTFKVAVYAGATNLSPLENQPIAIVLEPEISYFTFPEHFHLNVGMFDSVNNFYFPDSLCYTDDPKSLGKSQEERLLKTFDYVSIWLFRHQIWEASRAYRKRGNWIGPDVRNLTPDVYPPILDPNGTCWCGSNKKYKDCHSNSDLLQIADTFSEMKNISIDKAKKYVLKLKLNVWEKNCRLPKRNSLNVLKKHLIDGGI